MPPNPPPNHHPVRIHLWRKNMLTCDYIVERIDGDYALLRRIDMPEEELKTIARELLPPEIVEGSKLHYEWMQYNLI